MAADSAGDCLDERLWISRLMIKSRTTPLTAAAGWHMKVNDREGTSLEDWAPFQVPYETGLATPVLTQRTLPEFELRLKLNSKDPGYLRCFSTLHGGLLRERSRRASNRLPMDSPIPKR